MNLPNLLSLSRIALMPFILVSLRQGWAGVLLGLMLAAAATDYLDGWLARRMGRVTDLGKILDPLADKVCVDSMAVALTLWRDFPWWAAVVIVGRDLLILTGGLLLIKSTKAVPVSNLPGKAAVTAMAGALVGYAMRWQPWGCCLLVASLALAAYSGVVYFKEFIAKRKG